MIPMQSIQRFELWMDIVTCYCSDERCEEETTRTIHYPPTIIMQKQIKVSLCQKIPYHTAAVLYKSVFHSFLPPLTN